MPRNPILTGIAIIAGVTALCTASAAGITYFKESVQAQVAPQIYDVTGDGLEDIVIKDPNTRKYSCLVNLGNDNYRKTSFKFDSGIPFCEVPRVGFYYTALEPQP